MDGDVHTRYPPRSTLASEDEDTLPSTPQQRFLENNGQTYNKSGKRIATRPTNYQLRPRETIRTQNETVLNISLSQVHLFPSVRRYVYSPKASHLYPLIPLTSSIQRQTYSSFIVIYISKVWYHNKHPTQILQATHINNNACLTAFMKKVDQDVENLFATHRKKNTYNLTIGEHRALQELKNSNELIIKAADKGGASHCCLR